MPAPPPLSLTPHAVGTLQHNTFQFSNYGLRSFFQSGGNLYLIVRAQFPTSGIGGGTNEVEVWKSTNKVTWNLIASVPHVFGDSSQGCSIVAVGSVIFILSFNTATATAPLFWHRFDTGTDAFLADTATGPNAGALGFTTAGNAVTLLNSGHILVTQDAPPGAGNLTAYDYDPVGDTWSAGTILAAGGHVLAQIHDPATDLTFCFYLNSAGSAVRCATITGALAFTDVLVKTLDHVGSLHDGDVGTPVISSALNEVVLPFKELPAAGAPQLLAARATVAATPAFAVDTVETVASLPPNFLIQQWDQNSAAPWFAYDLNGTLYIFYAVDNGDLDNASSQCFLYYRTSEAVGVWDSSNIAFSSAVPGEMIAAFGSPLGAADPIILIGVVNPVTFPADAALTDFILFGAVSVVVSCNNPPIAQFGVPYSHAITASGGSGIYTFAITSGSLPPGLSMDSNGLITGIPVGYGVFGITVTATDNTGASGSVNCTVTVAAPGQGGGGSPGIGGGPAGPGGAVGGALAAGVNAGNVASGLPVTGCGFCCPVIKSPFKTRKRKTEFDCPPPGSMHVRVSGTTGGPATTTPVEVCRYQVPTNRRFQLDGIVFDPEVVNNWTPGDGNVIFSVTVDRTPGGTEAQGVPFKDYGAVTIPLGSLFRPWLIPPSDRMVIESRSIVRILVQTDPLSITPGAATRFVGLLKGWEWGVY